MSPKSSVKPNVLNIRSVGVIIEPYTATRIKTVQSGPFRWPSRIHGIDFVETRFLTAPGPADGAGDDLRSEEALSRIQ